MWTTKNPTHCPECSSEDIYLKKQSDKDEKINAKNTRLGVWYCNKCGNIIGRRMNQYENDIDENSI